MNQPLDKQAILDHYQGELRAEIRAKQEKLHSAILVKICEDSRLADIIRVFEAGDERRRQTVWRLACALSGKGL